VKTATEILKAVAFFIRESREQQQDIAAQERENNL